MQQIEKQAFALKIYEDMKIKLQDILKQFEMEKQEMEIKIQILQHQISEKDLKIQALTSRLKDKFYQKSVNLNLLTVQNNFESEPILGKQKQRSNNSKKYVQKQFLRIDINSYFTALIDKNTKKLSKQSTQSKQSAQNPQTDNTHDTLHFSRSCQKLTSPTFSNQNYQNFSHQIQSSQKIKIISNYFQNQQKIKTIKQTSFKNFLSQKSIKQNDQHFLSSKQFKPNQITINDDQNQQNLFVCSNINKIFKQSTQKGWKTSNFIPQNVKPRKIPFTVIKTPNLKV